MSAAGAREFYNEGIDRENVIYRTEGSLALERVRDRARSIEEEFQPSRTLQIAQPQERSRERSRLNAGNAALLLFLIFGVVMVLLYLQSVIQHNNIVTADLKKELTAIQKEGSELDLQIVMQEDMAALRERAEEDFGMDAPGEGQIRHIRFAPDIPLAAQGN